MRMPVSIYVLLLSSVLGCARAYVATETRKTDSAYAPINEKNGGTVLYLNEGMASVKKRRRQNAYEKMFKSCNGPYKIVNEHTTNKQEASFSVPAGFPGTRYESNQDYVYIDFECVQ